MADSKITDLTLLAGANLATGDTLEIVDVSVTTDDAAGSSRKTTLGDVVLGLGPLGLQRSVYNASVSAQSYTTTDAYIAGSSCAIPTGSLQAKTIYRCRYEITKTSTTSSTSAPILQVRIGNAASTADTTRCSLTFPAQTAVADSGIMEVFATFRTVGSGTSAVLHTVAVLQHALSITGLSTSVVPRVSTVSSGFDSTTANGFIGCSVNFGTSWAGSVNLVHAELLNLA